MMLFKRRKKREQELVKTKIRILEDISVGIGRLASEFTRLQVMDSISSVMDGYIWFKDETGVYQYASPRWINVFFDLPETFNIVGKNDIALLNGYRSRTGNEHTYGEMCVGTDAHCMAEDKTCRYIEIGYIAENIFILDVVKTPVKDKNGNLIGTVGFARDRSRSKRLIQEELKTYAKMGWVENLDPTSYQNDIVAYFITRTAGKFLNDNNFIPREVLCQTKSTTF
jgi:hypothetical protein